MTSNIGDMSIKPGRVRPRSNKRFEIGIPSGSIGIFEFYQKVQTIK